MNTSIDTAKSVVLFQSNAPYPVDNQDDNQIIAISKGFFPLFWAAMLNKSHFVQNNIVDMGKLLIAHPYIIIATKDAYRNLKQAETFISDLLSETTVQQFQKWVEELFEKIKYDYLHINPFKHFLQQKVGTNYNAPIFTLVDFFRVGSKVEKLSAEEKDQFLECFKADAEKEIDYFTKLFGNFLTNEVSSKEDQEYRTQISNKRKAFDFTCPDNSLGYNRKNPVIQDLLNHVLEGSVEHQYLLGTMYLNGCGVKQNISCGLELLYEIGAKGHQNANYELALYHYNIQAYDQVEAFIKAAYPHSEAICLVGKIHLYGQGVAIDKKLALECFKKAASLGSLDAMVELGCLYFYDEDYQDLKRAKDVLKHASKNYSSEAALLLGHEYLDGIMIQQNDKKAAKYFEKSACLRNPFAIYEHLSIKLESASDEESINDCLTDLHYASQCHVPFAKERLGFLQAIISGELTFEIGQVWRYKTRFETNSLIQIMNIDLDLADEPIYYINITNLDVLVGKSAFDIPVTHHTLFSSITELLVAEAIIPKTLSDEYEEFREQYRAGKATAFNCSIRKILQQFKNAIETLP